MADVYTRIGYIKGATGAPGAQGAKGDTGDAATIQVGSVTTVPYGQTANVVNSGTEQAAVFDFTIPQGRPGQQVTEMDNLLLNSVTTSAAEFPLPAVGETGKVLWGKVVKWFSDMAALVATKLNAANVVNNLTTTSFGYALDARQGKALNDTKLNVANVVNNVTTSEEGYALDARVGKSMHDYMRAHYDSSYELERPFGTTVALLDTINTLRTQSKDMPFCIQKAGTASVSDLPSVILVRFSPQSSGTIFLRNGYKSEWYGNWCQINVISVS